MQASQVDVTEELVQRQLFGGAFDMSMPARFADISSFRPVPDSQEVCLLAFAPSCFSYSSQKLSESC